MGLSPINAVREIARIDATGKELEVKPPFALERSGWMGDDACGASEEEAARGLEEEAESAEDETSENVRRRGRRARHRQQSGLLRLIPRLLPSN